jgi:NitT/TauT family transport system permease protein
MKTFDVLNAVVRYLPLVILAAAWELVSRSGLISQFALPPLSEVLGSWWSLAKDGTLFTNGESSLWRIMSGLGLAIVLGTTAGIAMAWNQTARTIVNPVIQIFYPMPKSALIPVMILWFGIGDLSKIVLVFIGCMLPIVINSYNGARGVDHVYIWSALSLGASRRKILWQIVIPGAMPEVLTGIRTAIAISFVLLISSELLISRDGLGYLVSSFGDGGVYPAMFAVILTVVFMGFCADRIFQWAMSRILVWRQ